MGRLIRLFSTFVLILIGCSDYSLKAYEEPSSSPIETPDIEVSPSSLNFGTLNADGEVSLKTITIKNKGSATLNIVSADLNNTSTVYTLSNLSDDELEPDEEANVTLSADCWMLTVAVPESTSVTDRMPTRPYPVVAHRPDWSKRLPTSGSPCRS